MATLRTLNGMNPGQLFTLDQDVAILGRHPDCDIVLEVAAVSRQHARIVRQNGNYYVEDLNSRNGTYLNGQLVKDRQPLSENDELQICDLSFVFYAERGPEDQPESSTTEFQPKAMMVDDERPSSGSTIMSKLEVSATPSTLRLRANPEAKLKALIEIGQNLGKAIGLEQVLGNLLDSLFKIYVQADRGFVVLKEPGTSRLIPWAVKHRRGETAETIRISRTIINSVMQTKEAILSADAANDSRFGMAESVIDFHIRSIMCAPMVGADGTALGVLQIDTLDQRSRFNRDDLDVLASVACQAAFAVENAQLHEAAARERAIERELSVAHQVQQGFLPATAPQVAGYDFFEYYRPANQLGGDYFDYVQMSGGRLGVVVADVSGKGIAASLLMARLSAETRYCLAIEPTPVDAVARLNRVFCDSSWQDRFVTFVLVVLDPSRHEVVVVNAGHMAPLLRHQGGSILPLGEEETRLPLGVDSGAQYLAVTFSLAPGDSLTMYTDGVTDAQNDKGEFYGWPRLHVQLAGEADGVRSLGLRILDDVRRFIGKHPQYDDMCITSFGRIHV